MKTLKQLLAESAVAPGVEDISHYEKEHGTQMGSNSGGIHRDENGKRHYVKFYQNPDQAKAEVAANKIHQMLGVKTLPAKLVTHNGRVGVASEYNPNIKPLGHGGYRDMTEKDAHQLGKIYHAAVLTKNWDSIGLDVDNVVRDHSSGHLLSVDHGGAFHFRAQGGAKEYDHGIDEKHSLLQYEPSASIYNHAFRNHPSAQKSGIDEVRNLSYDKVHDVFKSVGLSNHKQLADALWSRRGKILS